ncbi:MAG: type IV pilus biogenesis/stability protein PilW [Methylophilaceae bacterium]|jgi:type IV pilus assembly protein PilF|uniref:type IV pilus biogenesis/stability protein PilW n=1 Tax=Methylobacillus sp. MM3 TaxID=1848039 RepID=UPI0007DE956F|nr:type IV pilus biogenesis/stability protein PilW [Methylobacillus sp. MM3]OAJ71736.1 type IV pilus biogenesis/stability protein PilW [Methylobacillus sp. MM3]
MKKLLVILMALVLAACAAKGVRTGEDSHSRNRAKLHTELAAAYYSQGQMAIALDEFTKATELDSSYAPAYTGLGLVHAALKQDAKAESNFKRALQLEPENSEAHNNYGTFLCVRNRVDEAISEFMTAVKNPLYATPESAYLNAGICALKKKDIRNAETYFQNALRVEPNMRAASYQLAQLYFGKGEHLQARAHLEQAMKNIDPTPEMLWLGVRNERILGGKDAEASYRLLLRRKYPNSDETKAMLAE